MFKILYRYIYKKNYKNVNWMISSSSILPKSYAFGSLHIKVNLYILQRKGAKLLKWVLNLQHLQLFVIRWWFYIVVDSLLIAIVPIVLCMVLALLCTSGVVSGLQSSCCGIERCLLYFFASWCHVAVSVLCLFLTVLWFGLVCVIVVFPDHTHLLFQESTMIMRIHLINSKSQSDAITWP